MPPKRSVKKSKKAQELTPPPSSQNEKLIEDPVSIPKYAKGSLREYWITTPPKDLASRRDIHGLDKVYLSIITVLAFVTRFWKIWHPDSVVFDEVHFGGFARKYLTGKFFMDVHPPLAKMLFAAVASIGGYNGTFEFKNIGDNYTDDGNVPYILMRSYPALLGSLTVLLFYLTLKASGSRSLTAFIASFAFVFENSNVTISRYILLDSPLVFFMALTVYSFKKFEIQNPFTLDWFRYLLLTGLGLGLTVSCKWVGLFTIAWVGVITVYQLWEFLGDLTINTITFLKHLFFRVVFLIFVPIGFYVAMFGFHFAVLGSDGDGSAFMSPEFKNSLDFSDMPKNIYSDVGIGSTISIKHANTHGGYLHSHDHLYETGSKQQQITLYPHKDSNNNWIIENNTFMNDEELFSAPFTHLKQGTQIKLRHQLSFRRLHSHDVRPPVTEQDWQNEVSAYGFEGFEGDANDIFWIDIAKESSEPGLAQEQVVPIHTKFRLVHLLTGCRLFSHNVKLPSWAFEQQEVTCGKQTVKPLELWYIEENYHPQLNATSPKVSYKELGFWAKFFELHQTMWNINKGLTDHHHWESRPESWPIMLRGINYWVRDHTQVYLLGNAIVWYGATLSIVLFSVYKVIQIILWQRNGSIGPFVSPNDKLLNNFDYQGIEFIVGWALHFFPSFLMVRQLFLHHYICALYFGILSLALSFDFIISKLSSAAKQNTSKKIYEFIGYGSLITFILFAVGFFIWYSPLIYASKWTKSRCEASRLLKGWDFDCNAFPENITQYKIFEEESRLAKLKAPEPTTVTSSVNEEIQSVETVLVQEEPIEQDHKQEQIIQVQEIPPAVGEIKEPEVPSPPQETPKEDNEQLNKPSSQDDVTPVNDDSPASSVEQIVIEQPEIPKSKDVKEDDVQIAPPVESE